MFPGWQKASRYCREETMSRHNRKTKFAAALAIATLSLSGAAFADPDRGRTVTVSGYASDHGPRYDYARVLSADPIVRYVTVTTPVRDCWRDVEYYTVNRPAPGVGANTVAGAVVGGVIGNQFGSGRGNDAATVAGALIGAAIGNEAGRNRHGYISERYSRPVTRCETRIEERQEQRIDGYRVTYQYRGERYQTRMPYDPGRELRIRVDIRPAG